MIQDIDLSRKYFYEFFSKAFNFIDENEFKIWHEQVLVLAQSPLDDSLKSDFEKLSACDFESFKEEQNGVFFDFSYVNVPISASFYDEGRDDGKMKLQACEIIRKTKFRKKEDCRQSEDEFGFLFAFMASIIEYDLKVAQQLFRFVINPVIDEFIEKLQIHKNSNYYIAIANIMKVFFVSERAYLEVQAPAKKEGKTIADEALQRLPYEPRLPTKFSKTNIEELSKL
ncbi:molecular chaperone TorD family protein [Campylobacter lari]|uniref:Putative formate dehydrogenase-specific chaperone n=1 Tax=Campylobacter lari (strain RM2100 / D67 / ATCC BAA-1060) TaxID=306263 RepID=B9KF80_CAMLR|nr:molecular chaperone TorD family protein [Campylobacter lari]ACM63715.1 putative formate dehydrogenase-specific chaperone [Campylobacter lari RM2100]EAH6292920.1 formate dehydrogenase-specific chaperone [Campylobacter lari]EAH7188067.1 formate dehydrogenase-specific chaperone [Campylobacter lari]EAH8152368.1 formate dehydrogenase-specific chaperone [Campylobacter lari]EAI4484173.1 formate dehydrogenase-specific chaperone [Campylobacter lari]